MDKENVVMWYICNGILFSLKQEGISAICSSMDKHGGHYAKFRNKPDTERLKQHSFTYVESKTVKFIEAENRIVVTRSSEWGNGEMLVKQYKIVVRRN